MIKVHLGFKIIRLSSHSEVLSSKLGCLSYILRAFDLYGCLGQNRLILRGSCGCKIMKEWGWEEIYFCFYMLSFLRQEVYILVQIKAEDN